MLRYLLFSLTLVLIMGSASAEEPVTTSGSQPSAEPISRNLFVEAYGSTLGVGVGYDQRFRPTSVFGFRAGLSFTDGSWNDNAFGHHSLDFKGVTIPLEANAIFGKRASKFELGIGAVPCILRRHEVEDGWTPENSRIYVKDGTKMNIYGSLNIGYRLQRKSGFFMRAGVTFLLGDIKYSPFDGLWLMPSLSLGYTIR